MQGNLRTPNSEQKLAIEHNGGVLLQAGAGSGKTFCLIEHIFYLLKNTEKEKVVEKLSRTVLMTFTKKAAGELRERLELRLENIEDSLDPDTYRSYEEAISKLFVGTIHSFCMRLIQDNFFELEGEIEIVDYPSFKEKIRQLVKQYFVIKENNNTPSQLVSYEKQVLDTMIGIFNDPLIRSTWLTPNSPGLNPIDIFIDELELDNLFDGKYLISKYPDQKDKKWYLFFEDLYKNVKKPTSNSDLLENYEFFKKYKRLPSKPRGDELEEIIDLFVKIKNYRDFLKKHYESFIAFENGLHEKWDSEFQSIIQYIDEHYWDIPGNVFADLEYYTYLKLREDFVATKVAKKYDYFIVDEFQDTSQIQYDIIKLCTNNDLNKAFFVGDPKQAIYGFRGGELGVFLDCSKNIKNNVYLKNNYRSVEDVVLFNNDLFEHLFPLGEGYLNKDRHTIPMQKQLPHKTSQEVSIDSISIESSSDEIIKLSSEETNVLEAKGILKYIDDTFSVNKDREICILYRGLGPSFYLLTGLLEKDYNIEAQSKIPYSEDPILGIFLSLLEYKLDINKNKNLFINFILKEYFCLLKNDVEGTGPYIDDFLVDIDIFGIFNAFEKWLYKNNIINHVSNYNMAYIKSLCSECADNINYIIKALYELSDRQYGLTLKKNGAKGKIKILTAHASKGLEFDIVVLAGIHTNEGNIPNREILGKYPLSFKWKDETSNSKYYSTPSFIAEKILQKNKEFSESKRLFYVANTRAENKIMWTSFSSIIKAKSNKNSWINGITAYMNERPAPVKMNIDSINYDKESETDSFNKLPFFHYSNKDIKQSESIKRTPVILPDLSVTHVSSLAICPKLFYLKNICKISTEDLNDLELTNEPIKKVSSNVSSNMQRGSDLHKFLELSIKNDLKVPSDIDIKEKKVIDWSLNELAQYKNDFTFISEKAIRFKFFDYMISGTADLVLIPKGEINQIHVYDFKTGSKKEFVDQMYQLQAMIYGLAYSQMLDLDDNAQIITHILYLDEKIDDSKKLSLSELTSTLLKYWNKTDNYFEENLDYCASCSYGKICHNSL